MKYLVNTTTNLLVMENKCRVCLTDSENMVNIFEEKLDLGISIAHMISKCTGLKIEKKDSFPVAICPPCLEDAHSAFAIMETYERSYQIFREVLDAVLEEDEIIELSDSDEGVLIEEEEEEEVHSEGTMASTYEETAQEEVNSDHPEEVCEDKRHACTQCHMSYQSPRLLELHILRHHRRKRLSPMSSADNNENTEPIIHTSTHTAKGEKRKQASQLAGYPLYKCNLCGKTFPTISNCRRHYKTHTGDRPFQCDICQKSFSEMASVKRHKRIHTGERPFKCHICQSAFTDSSGLHQHRRIHTEEKPYKCDLCEKVFRSQSDARKHMRSHTGEKRHKCSLCERAFTQICGLRRHLALCHEDEA
ncbi:zinc finger protein 879 isoform X1 [Drosophila santomea]|uniref:zinc finger protein 879 isoform X1 n=2 Tax=Drosophila santomea TaxID=129105 RepID=UPI001953668C|nr:zinc finger protein 879 isoform X1 [Drosophila santomea]